MLSIRRRRRRLMEPDWLQEHNRHSQKVGEVQLWSQQVGVVDGGCSPVTVGHQRPVFIEGKKRSKIPLTPDSDQMWLYNISAQFCCSHLILQTLLSKPSPLSRPPPQPPDLCPHRCVMQPHPPISSQHRDDRCRWLWRGIKDQTGSSCPPVPGGGGAGWGQTGSQLTWMVPTPAPQPGKSNPVLHLSHCVSVPSQLIWLLW